MDEIEPAESVPVAPARWNGWRVAVVVLAGVAALYLIQIVIGAVFAVGAYAQLYHDHQVQVPTKEQLMAAVFTAPALFFMTVPSEAIMAVIAIGLAISSLGATRAQLGFGRPFRASDILVGIVAGGALVAIGAFAEKIQKFFLGEHPQASLQVIMTHHGASSFALDFISVALAAGVCEEIMFRGVLFTSLAQRLPVWAAAVISGIVFGLAHADPWNLVVLACVGIGLAILYWRTRSLWPNMVAHTAFNAFSLVLIYWFPQYAK